MKFFTEVAVPEDSPDRPGGGGRGYLQARGVRVIDVLRGDASLRRDLTGVTLEAGDRVVLRTEMAEVLGLAGQQGRAPCRQAVLGADRDGRGADRPRLPDGGQRWATCACGGAMASMCWRCTGATRTSGGSWTIWSCRWATRCCWKAGEDIQRLAADMDLVDISRPRVMAFRGQRPDCAGGAGADRGLAALDVAPILPLALIGVAVILVTHCVDSDEAFSFVDGRLLAMIFAMLAWVRGWTSPARST
jgi:hypothetical protein